MCIRDRLCTYKQQIKLFLMKLYSQIEADVKQEWPFAWPLSRIDWNLTKYYDDAILYHAVSM